CAFSAWKRGCRLSLTLSLRFTRRRGPTRQVRHWLRFCRRLLRARLARRSEMNRHYNRRDSALGPRLYLGALTRTTPEASSLDCHSVSPARRAGRMDRPGRLQGDNDTVE